MDVHTEIRRHYEAYGTAFSTLDPDAATEYWHAPSIRTDPDEVGLDAAIEDRHAGFTAAIVALEPTDYDHSEAVAICSHALSDSLALSNVVWHRLTDDGAVQARFSPLHVLRRTGAGWRFVARATRRSDDPIAMRPAGATEERGEAPDAVAAFFEEYARAITTGDEDAVAAAWHDQSLVVSPAVRTVTGPAEVEPVVGRGEVEVTAVHAHELDAGVAVADVVWEADESRVATLNLLHRTDQGWRLVAVGRHPPESAVTVGAPRE